jgi:HSP20 family protein
MLMRTDPFRQLDRLFEQVSGTAARPAAMPMDAWRAGHEFVVELDLPGIDPDSIDLDAERNVLTIRAERQPKTGPEVELVVSERPRGVFSRQIFLGDTLDAGRIDASYQAGVLRLTIPVAEQAKPRKIAISTPAAAGDDHVISTTSSAEDRQSVAV